MTDIYITWDMNDQSITGGVTDCSKAALAAVSQHGHSSLATIGRDSPPQACTVKLQPGLDRR